MSEEPEYLEAERVPAPGGGKDGGGAGVGPGAGGGPGDGGSGDGGRGPGAGRATPDPARVRAAWTIAIAADVIQWLALPAFAPGIMSPVANVLDVAVALVMVGLFGWHWAFLPTFVAELVPFVDLVPTWTLAVWIAGRRRARG